jgi:hypothetical protein
MSLCIRTEITNPLCTTSIHEKAMFLRVGAYMLLLLFFLALPTFAAAPARILAFDTIGAGSPQALLISMSEKPTAIQFFTLTAPTRLVMDISPARMDGANRSLTADDHPLLRGIRVAQFNPQTVRVVFDLKTEATYLTAWKAPIDDGSMHQLEISLFTPEHASPLTNKVPGQLAANDAEQAEEPSVTAAAPTPAATKPAPGNKILIFGETKTTQTVEENASAWGLMEFSGSVMAKGAQQLHESGDFEQARMLRNTIRLQGKWTPPTSAVAAGDRHGITNTFLLGSLQSDYLGFGPDPSSDEYDLELYEGYLFHATPGWDMRLGRQIVRWGKADQISPVDNINPQDMREFILPDLEERKMPNWMARFRLFPGDVTLEGIFVPFFESNEFDFSGNTWALLGSQPSGLRIRESKPADSLDNADWGLRTATTIGRWDVALSYLYATEKTPRLRFEPMNPLGPTLFADYHRQNIYGFEFETTIEKFGFRGEGAYFDEQSLNTETLNSVAKPVAHYLVGVDYLAEEDWYANVQLSHQHVFDYESDILYLRRDNFYLNGEINKEFWRGNAMLKLTYGLDLRDGGSYLRPEGILTYYKNLELSLGFYLFAGPADSLLGRYHNDDQVYLKGTYFF